MIDGRENATVGSDVNFRFRMLLKGAVEGNTVTDRNSSFKTYSVTLARRPNKWRGIGGWEPGSYGGGKCTGGGRREGRRRDTQGGGSRER